MGSVGLPSFKYCIDRSYELNIIPVLYDIKYVISGLIKRNRKNVQRILNGSLSVLPDR